MEITCRNCGTKQNIDGAASPIVKCKNCLYPIPVMSGGGPKGYSQPRTAGQSTAAPNSASNIPKPKPTAPTELGWLVVHDENADQQTHPVRIGRQIIGRKSVSRPCDIMIDTEDAYMGRNHCILEVKPNRSGSFDFFISDVKMTNGVPEQMSTNGTFVNAQPTPLKPKDMVYLKDGDTIQMGQTKVVIKTLISAATATDASRIVQDTDYMPTVIIR